MSQQKRAADDEWVQSDAKSQASAEAERPEMPHLNDDCIRVVMELALGQRTLATYGADGHTVVEARDYYGSPYWPATHFWHGSIHTFRLVCRSWNRIASPLVRVVIFREEMSLDLIIRLPKLFPDASTIVWSRNEHFPSRDLVCDSFDDHRRRILPNCPPCTFVDCAKAANPHVLVRALLARNNTIVRDTHAEYDLWDGLNSESRAYRFRSWKYFCQTLSATTPANFSPNAVIAMFVEAGDPEQHRKTFDRISQLKESLAKAQAAGFLQHIQLHLMIDSSDRDAFITQAQTFFPHKFIIHTSFKPSWRSGSPFHKRSTFAPNVFFDAPMYRALWASQGILIPFT